MININGKIEKIVLENEEVLNYEFKKIDKIAKTNSLKVLKAFHNNKISDIHFSSTTGYGYNDIGRDAIEAVFAEVLGSEDALVRNQFISGTHALTVCLFGLLRPNDLLLSITGKPYDTLEAVIGITPNDSSLISFGIKYDEIDLVNDDFDYDAIEAYLKVNKVKVIEIQRSKGYSTRKSISISKLGKVISFIRKINDEVIIMVDNCYCEFVSSKEPTEVGANIMVGSLIKNLGGGLAPNGAYIAGSKHLVDLCAQRLTVPGCGKEVGPTLGINKSFLQGLYMAPSAIASALKTAILASFIMEKLGYDAEPKYNAERADIVQNIIFNDKSKLIKFCQGIQEASAIDSSAHIMPSDMPGYQDQIIMASGSFTNGSSIEISCDGPVRTPYIAYLQGSLTYEYGELAIKHATSKIIE